MSDHLPENTPPARICTYDIEVQQGGSGPPVVSEEGTERAANPITAICAHDSYTGEYQLWILAHSSWDADDSQTARGAVDADVSVYSNPADVASFFCQWVVERDFDVLTGWNCIPEGTSVLMADGSTKPIESIDVGDSVVGIDGDETAIGDVVATSGQREKRTVNIKTQNGTDVAFSEDHEVLVGDEDRMEWKNASDVRESDYILRPKSLPRVDTDVSLPLDPYLMGLVASDGSVSRKDGVVFYNGEEVLHDQFPTENNLTYDSRGEGTYSQRVFTNEDRRWIASIFEDVGIPLGAKKDKVWDLSRISLCQEDTIAQFLAGYMDGDGYVSDRVAMSAANESARYWISRLLRRIDIWATCGHKAVHVGRGSVGAFKSKVGEHMNHPEKLAKLEDLEGSDSGVEGTVPPWIATHRREEDGRTGFRIINDKIRRGINVKRWEAEEVDSPVADAYSDFVFERVSDVSEDGTRTCYDIETTVSSFIADDVVVHNSSSFDHPYLFNYCLSNGVSSVYDLSPTGDVYPMNGDGSWANQSLKGRLLVDLLDMYKKCQIHELDSYRLADVAKEEDVSVGKLSIEDEVSVPQDEPAIDYVWENQPSVFCEYSLKDVMACASINRESMENVTIL